MDAYKKTIRARALALALAAIAAAAILVYGIVAGYFVPQPDSGEGFDFANYFAGFQVGGIGALAAVFAVSAIKLFITLGNEAKLKRFYITENDERKIFIHRASGGFILHACAIVILLAAAFAGYFSQQIFFSLLGCAVFLMIVKVTTIFYLSRKY